ncbi:MAG: MFS transporter [SAR202 cluster bacterium]|nr:MFS transporter [SAR202 cluster bacterium]
MTDAAPPARQSETPGDHWIDTGMTRRQVRLTLAGVMLAMFLASLDQTIVATALPRIVAGLGGFDRFTWVTTAYILASTTVVPLAGSASDVYGRKWLFVGALAVFLFGSVLSGIAPSMDALIAFRAIQGIGGGMIMALSFVTIGDIFPPSERGKYQGLIAAMFGVSSILGPTLGGVLTDSLSWHWIFFVNLPLGIPVVLAFIRFFPNATVEKKRRIDWAGAFLLVAAVLPAMLALTWGASSTDWTEPRVVGGFALSGVALVAFLFVESRIDDPLLPLHLFRGRVVGISMVAIFLTGFGMFGAIIFVPLLFQGVLGASATASGSFLTPMMLGVVAGAALSGQALSRTGGHYRIQGAAGIATMLVGVGMLAASSADTTRAWALAAAVVTGFGLGITFPVFTIAVQNGVPQRYLGVATSSTQFFRSIGGAIGLAVLGAFMVSRFKSGLAANLPPEALSKITQGVGQNPNALVDPDTLGRLRASLDSSPPGLLEQVLGGLRAALAGALADVFMVAFVVIALALLVTLFIKEIPLKQGGKGSPRPH